ncbi:hypothetical protein AB2G25_25505, partial (plasmid) [Escherichia coli]
MFLSFVEKQCDSLRRAETVATYHLSVKFGGKGQVANHADYIGRKGEYAKRKDLEY